MRCCLVFQQIDWSALTSALEALEQCPDHPDIPQLPKALPPPGDERSTEFLKALHRALFEVCSLNICCLNENHINKNRSKVVNLNSFAKNYTVQTLLYRIIMLLSLYG